MGRNREGSCGVALEISPNHSTLHKYPSFQLCLEPVCTSDYGTNASLTFVQHDGTPQGHIFFGLVIQLSENTDIFGIALRCLQFLPLILSVILKI